MFLVKPDTGCEYVSADKTRSSPGAPCIIIALMLWIAPSETATAKDALAIGRGVAAKPAVPSPHVAEAE